MSHWKNLLSLKLILLWKNAKMFISIHECYLNLSYIWTNKFSHNRWSSLFWAFPWKGWDDNSFILQIIIEKCKICRTGYNLYKTPFGSKNWMWIGKSKCFNLEIYYLFVKMKTRIWIWLILILVQNWHGRLLI